jgi:hypothetical protein
VLSHSFIRYILGLILGLAKGGGSPFCHSIVIVVAAWSAWPLPTGPTKATRDVMAKIKVDVTSGARHVQKSLGVIRG